MQHLCQRLGHSQVLCYSYDCLYSDKTHSGKIKVGRRSGIVAAKPMITCPASVFMKSRKGFTKSAGTALQYSSPVNITVMP